MPAAPNTPRVLVVEDDWLVLELLRTVLQSDGLDVMVAPGPLAAIGFLRARRPDLIVTDFFAGTTPEACRRSLGNLPDVAGSIPILAVTGRRLDASVPPTAFGVDDLLGKPFDVDEVISRVRSLLNRQDRSDRQDRQDRPLEQAS